MNCMRKSLNLSLCCFNLTSKNFFIGSNYTLEAKLKNNCRFCHEVPQSDLQNSEKSEFIPYLHRDLKFLNKYVKPKEVWIENFDAVKEEKRGLIELHPKIFGTIPRLDIIYNNVRWQQLYNKVILYSAKTRAEKWGGGRKPHPQKGLGIARQGSIRAPHLKGGGSCHGPRNPTSHFFVLPFHQRIHGLTSTFSVKLAQDDLHVIDNINIPTEDSQFILDLIKERHWGSSVLIVDKDDIMPRNITIATDTIEYVNLMPSYGLNVYSMLKHETLVLTVAAVEEIENQLLEILHSPNILELQKKFDFNFKW